MKSFFHIVNPNKNHVKVVREFFSKNPDLQYMWVERTSHPTHLETIVLWAVNEGHSRIAVWGGDGTLSRVVQCLFELNALEKITVALIPMGTCNDFARKLGLPVGNRGMNKYFKAKGSEQMIDVGLLSTPLKKRVFINNAGFGRASERIRGRSNPLQDILSFTPKKIDLNWTLNKSDFFESRDCLLGIVFNSPFFSGGLYFDKHIEPTDGVLNGFFESPQSKWGLLWKFFKSRWGVSLSDNHTFRVDGQVLRLESNEDLFPQVDGEAVADAAVRSLKFSLLPQKLRLYNWR